MGGRPVLFDQCMSVDPHRDIRRRMPQSARHHGHVYPPGKHMRGYSVA